MILKAQNRQEEDSAYESSKIPYKKIRSIKQTRFYFDGAGSNDPDGTIVSYSWDFGDGNTGSGITTTHSYSVSRSFTVTLTVNDKAGDSNTDTLTITALDEIDGLVAEYLFEGNANDTSGNENHGTIFGATKVIDRFGNTDGAYSFDGVDDWIELTELGISNSYSFALWINPTNLRNGQCFISKKYL